MPDDAISRTEFAGLKEQVVELRAKQDIMGQSLSGFREEVAEERGANQARWAEVFREIKGVKDVLTGYRGWFMGLLALGIGAILSYILKG